MQHLTEVQQIAHEWMTALERDTGGNPDFFARLNQIHLSDNTLAYSSGISVAMIHLLQRVLVNTTITV